MDPIQIILSSLPINQIKTAIWSTAFLLAVVGLIISFSELVTQLLLGRENSLFSSFGRAYGRHKNRQYQREIEREADSKYRRYLVNQSFRKKRGF